VPTPYSSILPTSLCRSRGLFVLLNARPHSWRINKPLPFNGLHTLQKGVSASPTFQSSCALFEKHRGGYTPQKRISSETASQRLRSVRIPADAPQHSRDATFHAHAQAYISAARVLRNANTSQRNKAVEHEATESVAAQDNSIPRQLDSKGKQRLEGNHFKGRKEGGQVPHSVRIQAPARQRGSVSP
jgi:hypothetical protein